MQRTEQVSSNGAKLTHNGNMHFPPLDNVDRRTAVYRDIVDMRGRLLSELGGEDHVD